MTMAKSFDALVVTNEGLIAAIPHNKSIMKGNSNKDVHQEVAAAIDAREEKNEFLLRAAMELIRDTQRVSTSSMQRRLGISYSRANLVVETLQERGIIGPARGDEPREILVDLEDMLADNFEKEESRPGAKKGRWEDFRDNADFGMEAIVQRDVLPTLIDIMGDIKRKTVAEHTRLLSDTNPETALEREYRLGVLSKIIQTANQIPSRPVRVHADNVQAAHAENEEIMKKIYSFLEGMGKSFNTLMGGELDEVIKNRREVTVGILKRKGYPLCEIMTPDAKVRFGFVGYIPDEEDPFREIDWTKDQIRMSVVFKDPAAKRGEDNRLRIPHELGLRYSNLNSLNGLIKLLIWEHYKPYNKFVNEFQARRFSSAHGETTDENGIRWIKRNNEMVVTAIDEKGVFGNIGTVLGVGKIIKTKNNASFTWWETNDPTLPRNSLIKAATENIIKIASTARIET